MLTRALDETFAAVVFARRKLGRAIAHGDPERLRNVLNRVVCGSRYMPDRDSRFPKSYNVQDMIDETDTYIAELCQERGKQVEGEWRSHYNFRCDFVHPSMGSFALYQRRVKDEYLFDRRFGAEPNQVPDILRGLLASSSMLLREAKLLSDVNELPPDWPGFERKI
jgi:hypothetical protein